jgi:outer membrane protein assembly factor BamD (BamD/ComL family)
MNRHTLRTAAACMLAALLLVSCSRNGQDLADEAEALMTKNDYKGAIAKLEELVKEYPDSPLASEALLRIGVLQMGNEELSPRAIPTMETLLAKYPTSPVAHKAVFLIGYMYNNRLQDLDKARKYYDRYLAQYPDSIYAKDVKVELANLGKTPEEMLAQAQAALQNGPQQPKK